jgi:hypothetical protein
MKLRPETKRLSMGVLSLSALLAGVLWFQDTHDAPTNTPYLQSTSPSSPSANSTSFETTPRSVATGLAPTKTPATKPAILFVKHGPVDGRPLPAKITGLNPHNAKGRVVELMPAASKQWLALKSGDAVELPFFDQAGFTGIVRLHQEDNGWHRFGGELCDGAGSFSLNINGDNIGGSILLPDRSLALAIVTEPSGNVLLVERPLSRLICWPPAPRPEALVAAEAATPMTADAAALNSSTPSSAASPVPKLNTKPSARGLIYLNFEGETVTDPSWNNGDTIVAAPSPLNADGILEVIARVAEDYAPFDVAVSTIRADYENSAPGRRMKVIVTPTDTALHGVGGVSFIGSWSDAGKANRSSTVPVWVFVSSPAKTVAEIISHEVGHTLGLDHDGVMNSEGITLNEYYKGHGGGLDNPTSWAPIMGTSYYRSVTQWSRGEYAGANNDEDDLAIISSAINIFGYASAAPPSDGYSNSGTALLPVTSSAFSLNGVLRRELQPDEYEFYTTGGTLSAAVKPITANYANADLQLELSDAAYTILALSNPATALEASLAKTLAPGTYKLRVRSAATGPAPAQGYTTGYSAYGSLGSYQLSGFLENGVSLPTLMGTPEVVGLVGRDFAYSIALSEGAAVAAVTGDFPPGITWSTDSQTLTGIPTVEGTWTLDVTLTSPVATISRPLKVRTVHPLPSLNGSIGTTMTSSLAPWNGQLCTLPDGTPTVMATNGSIPNSASTFFRFRVPGKSVVSFTWKTSTEADHDIAQVRINGLPGKDLDSGKALTLSGERGWTTQRFAVDTTGPSLVEVRYTKDSNLTAGQDRVWFGNLSVGSMPVFKKSPSSQRLKADQTGFSLETEAINANTFQWKKDGIVLSNGTFAGVEFSGATTPKLTLKGVSGMDSGSYTLDAKNSFTTVTSRAAEIAVPGAPVVGSHGIVGSGSLKTGDTLMLSLEAYGAKPLTTLWKKDGRPFRTTSGTTLQIRNATETLAGRYSATVLNAYGRAVSTEAVVTVSPRPAATSP